MSTLPRMLRTQQRTNSHRNYVMFHLPFIGCKWQLLVKRHAQNHEETHIEITSRFLLRINSQKWNMAKLLNSPSKNRLWNRNKRVKLFAHIEYINNLWNFSKNLSLEPLKSNETFTKNSGNITEVLRKFFYIWCDFGLLGWSYSRKLMT